MGHIIQSERQGQSLQSSENSQHSLSDSPRLTQFVPQSKPLQSWEKFKHSSIDSPRLKQFMAQSTSRQLNEVQPVVSSSSNFVSLVQDGYMPSAQDVGVSMVSSTGAGTGEEDRLEKGDVVYRKGQACTVIKVHYEEDPPYYEVHVHETGAVVGTERHRLTRR